MERGIQEIAMRHKTLALLTGLILSLWAPLASAADMKDYMSTPFWLEGRTIPQVLLVIERDWKVFYPAYNNLSDLDGDGVIDIGFNPAVTYVGYFDSDSCYAYDVGAGYFKRSGPAQTQTAEQLESFIPDVIKAVSKDTDGDGIRDTGVKVPLSKHGVCDRKKSIPVTVGQYPGDGLWHGNWLNFATTSRMDAIRKVLYGGKRQVDTTGQTILELTSFLPANAHNWGGELMADDLWEEYCKTSPWYDIPSFTAYNRPESGHMHFWARTSYYTPSVQSCPSRGNMRTEFFRKRAVTRTLSTVPLFQFAANIPSTNWHPVYITPLRIWDWIGDHGGGQLPNDYNLVSGPAPDKAWEFAAAAYPNKPAGQAARRFNARVEVCAAGNTGDGEGCRSYGSSSKPAGLLQEYGESGKMYFGLMTGSLNSTTRYEGGVIRHHIDEFSKVINSNDGTVVRSGLIDTIDRLQITGIGGYGESSASDVANYTDGTQAGNPLGEMVYEGMRYLARYQSGAALTPTDSYHKVNKEIITEVSLPSHKGIDSSKSQLPLVTDWSTRPALGEIARLCPKPVILVLSEIFPDRDKNSKLPNQDQLDKAPLMDDFVGKSVPEKFDIDTYLNLITKQEKLYTDADQKHFFYAEAERGICKPAYFSGLNSIDGLCPSEPSLHGSYTIAAVAYYAHTHDLYNLGGDAAASGYTQKSIDFYAVGMPANFPDITFEIDEEMSLTVMPITVALDYDTNTSTRLRTLINFFVESWHTDVNNKPFRVKFNTNFEYNVNPSYTLNSGSNNMERDIFNRFEIILLTTKDTAPEYREAMPVYINSGMLRTQSLAQWETDKAAYLNSNTPFPATNGGQPYYYAFKDPNPNSGHKRLDLLKEKEKGHIVGVAVQNYTLGSWVNMRGHGGYTISGVKHSGAYLDAGYSGKDNFYYGDALCHGNEPVILTADHNPAQGLYQCESATDWEVDRKGLPPNHHHPDLEDGLLTPWECPYADYSNIEDHDVIAAYGSPAPDPAKVCGKAAAKNNLMRYYQMRSFVFDKGANKINKLPNPLWLAAKYGGFKDSIQYESEVKANVYNGIPDVDSEWKRLGKGPDADDPYNYFGVVNMSDLPNQLGDAFEAILNSVAAGTATASSINSVLGGGISIQTQYRTEYSDPKDSSVKIKWPGSVYAFFVDDWGNLREDTIGDGILRTVTSPDPLNITLWNKLYPQKTSFEELGSLIVHSVTTSDASPPAFFLCRDIYGDNNGDMLLPSDELPSDSEGVPNPNYPENSACTKIDNYDQAATLWNAAKQLSYSNNDYTNTSLPDSRRLYTYFGDKAADGSDEWTSGHNTSSGVGIKLGGNNGYSFNKSEVNKLHEYMSQSSLSDTADLIDYIRGVDFAGKFRKRSAHLPWDTSRKQVWTMGDVINSRPVIVGEADSNFHLLFGDTSYSAFKSKYARRRQVAYFGDNGGILHAANLGFYGSLAHGKAAYSTSPFLNTTGTTTVYEPYANLVLGDELWGYIPTAVLPHLRWLADENYGNGEHGYYVDLKPRSYDVKDKNGQWRTILIVGLRLGGRTIELDNAPVKPTYSYSEYFALDVTDPDAGPPTLLWRFSHQNLGLSAATPVVVRDGSQWYVLLPSGPTSDKEVDGVMVPNTNDGSRNAYDGTSTQKARIFVLDALTGKTARDPIKNPLMVPEDKSFFNDAFLPKAKYVTYNPGSGEKLWSNHAVYIGITAKDSSQRDTGALYRVQMVDTSGRPLGVDNWELKRMYNTDKPLTGAVNSTYDSVGNLWVVFGTGRVWGSGDLAPCGTNTASLDAGCCENHDQYIYGLKEPMDSQGNMTFDELTETEASPPIMDVSGLKVYDNGYLTPNPNPTGVSYYNALYSLMISKTGTTPVYQGYKRKLESWEMITGGKDPGELVFEVVTTQPKLDAVGNRSNTVLSTYQPSANLCEPSGESYLLVYETVTGLPAPYMSAYSGFNPGGSITLYNSDGTKKGDYNQITGVKKAGSGVASEAWILKTGSKTIYGNTGSKRNMIYADGDTSVNNALISWREVLDMGFDLNIRDNLNSLFLDLKK